jgi:hypothetical protein
MTGFRASVVHQLTGDEQAWPVLEWREGDDTEVVTIIDVEDEDKPETVSLLMHYGIGINNSPGWNRWSRTSLVWNVTEMLVLKTLFQAAQHILGILELPKADATKLYCQNGYEGCSSEEQSPIQTGL